MPREIAILLASWRCWRAFPTALLLLLCPVALKGSERSLRKSVLRKNLPLHRTLHRRKCGAIVLQQRIPSLPRSHLCCTTTLTCDSGRLALHVRCIPHYNSSYSAFLSAFAAVACLARSSCFGLCHMFAQHVHPALRSNVLVPFSRPATSLGSRILVPGIVHIPAAARSPLSAVSCRGMLQFRFVS